MCILHLQLHMFIYDCVCIVINVKVVCIYCFHDMLVCVVISVMVSCVYCLHDTLVSLLESLVSGYFLRKIFARHRLVRGQIV
jgi:hypothetical protein